MNIKRIVKKILCPIRCFEFGIKYCGENLYIGKACKIVNAKRMRFGKNLSIMPYSMLFCHRNGQIDMGNGTEIGMFSRIASQEHVVIGNNVLTGPHIFIVDYNHEYRDLNKPIMYQGNLIKQSARFKMGGVLIGNDT